MTVFTLGSINIDHSYQVGHLPIPGETVLASGYAMDLGGKGANQSVAAAQAGARVVHIGMVGSDGQVCLDRLGAFGVDIAHVGKRDGATGHANIYVDPEGENIITVYPGANMHQDIALVRKALQMAQPGDWLLLQNETNCQVEAAKMAQDMGLLVAYSAAPFDISAVAALSGACDLLIMNSVEASQFKSALGSEGFPKILITKGADGAELIEAYSGEIVSVSAWPVTPVDSSGAGDCFAGYVLASLDLGLSTKQALTRAAAAAGVQVTRKGTASAIPQLQDVLDLIG